MHRRWSSAALTAITLGGAVGALAGLVAFGFPPVYLAPEDDDRSDCSVINQRAGAALSSELQPELEEVFPLAWAAAGDDNAAGAADTPAPEQIAVAVPGLAGVRCGDGMRAWGTPLRPTQRDRWVAALGTSLVELGFDVPGAQPLASGTAQGDDEAPPPPSPHDSTQDGEEEGDGANGEKTGEAGEAESNQEGEETSEDDGGQQAGAAVAALRTELSAARRRRARAAERLRAATAPQILEELEAGDVDELADVRRELLDAYSALVQAQEEVRELEEAVEAAEAAVRDDPLPGSDPDGGDGTDASPGSPGDQVPDDESPAVNDPEVDTPDLPDGDPAEEDAIFVPLRPTQLSLIVPSAAVPLTLGGLLGGLGTALLVGILALLPASLRPRRRRSATAEG